MKIPRTLIREEGNIIMRFWFYFVSHFKRPVVCILCKRPAIVEIMGHN